MRFDVSQRVLCTFCVAGAIAVVLGTTTVAAPAQSTEDRAAVELAALSGEWRGDVVVTRTADCMPSNSARGHAFLESPKVRLVLTVSADGDVAAGEPSGMQGVTPEMRWRGRIDSDMRVTLEAPGEMLCGDDRHASQALTPDERSTYRTRPYTIRYAGKVTRRGNGWQLDVQGDDQPCARANQCGLVRALRLRKR